MTVSDHEVLLELRDEPELLAVADALADVLPASGVTAGRRRRTSVAVAAAAGAVAVLGLAALLLAGNRVEPRLVDRALAAVGDAPVLHAVVRRQEAPETTMVELSTGRRVVEQRISETEIWFDEKRALEHTITRTTGQATHDELSTPQNVPSESGPVWTCARIAAHPVEATKARVSCNFSGDNGTKPRHVPEPPPTLDPALAGFVDGYRQALASGVARRIGEGTIAGRHVYWLEFRLPDPAAGEPPLDLREQVAVASDTYRPVLVRPINDGVAGQDYDVLEIETVGRDRADFSKPKLLPAASRPTSTSVVVTGELELGAASQVLGARALWAGPEIDGLKLAGVQRQEVTTGYGRGSGVPPRVTPVVALIYGSVRRGHPTKGSLEMTESTVPYAVWSLDPPPTPAGFVGINGMGWGLLHVGDVYVEITRFRFAAGVDDAVVAAARQLAPVPPG
jgi:hypothetical protein